MFIQLSSSEINNLKTKKLAQQISRWTSLEKAAAFYANSKEIYAGYLENHSNLNSAYSTPVFIYKIKKLPSR